MNSSERGFLNHWEPAGGWDEILVRPRGGRQSPAVFRFASLARERIAELEQELEETKLRWNKAASRMGAVGSEFINDPELVAKYILDGKEMSRKLKEAAMARVRELEGGA